MRVISSVLLASVLLVGCPGAHRTDGDDLESLATLAAEPSRSKALYNLDYAQAALAAGDADRAEQALRVAVGIMGTPRGDGEWAAIVGRESTKEWKGEPWERMGAYLGLGNLLFARGDRGNALAMYKSAVLADTGTTDERYRSDLVVGWTLQGLVLQGEGEPEVATDLFRKAADAVWSREMVEALTDTLHDASPVRHEGTQRAREALFAALPAGVAYAPRDPDRAVDAAVSRATELMQTQRKLGAHKRRQALQRFSKEDFAQASAAMPALAAAWKAELTALALTEPPLARSIEALDRARPNVVVVAESGRGPSKRATGDYNERLIIVPGRDGRSPRVVADGSPLETLALDSATFQATTRGGRRVDGWLHGKALYRDTGLISGYFLIYLSQFAAWRGDRRESTLLAVTGATLMVTAAMTIPEADVRAWDGMPESWHLATTTLPVGKHTLTVDGRATTVDLRRGQQVVIYAPLRGPLVATP